MAEPTAAAPITATLAWTPDQNFGAVSVMPGRVPIYAVWGMLRAGEDLNVVAEEHGLDAETVRVLDQLRREVAADELTRWANWDDPA